MGDPHKRSEEKVLRYIYEIKSNLDGRTYIGKHTPYKNENIDIYYGSGTHITNAIKKYGKENFSKRILFEDICTEKEINDKEIYYISEEKKKGKAEFNITSGGDGGYNENTYKSPKWRESISKSQKKLWANEEYRNNQIKKIKYAMANKSEEEKAEAINKWKITMANKSEEEKSNSAKKGVLHRSEQAKLNCSHKGCHWKQKPATLIKRYEGYLKSAKEKNNLDKINEYTEKIKLLKTTVKE